MTCGAVRRVIHDVALGRAVGAVHQRLDDARAAVKRAGPIAGEQIVDQQGSVVGSYATSRHNIIAQRAADGRLVRAKLGRRTHGLRAVLVQALCAARRCAMAQTRAISAVKAARWLHSRAALLIAAGTGIAQP